MKQKITTLMLALVSLMMLAACHKDEPTEPNKENPNKEQPHPTAHRYIGLDTGNKQIAPIYLPIFSDEMGSDAVRAEIISSNEKYGWQLFKDDTADDHKVIQFKAPRDDDGRYTDDRLFGDLYYHYKKSKYLNAWSKPLFNKDVVKAAHEGSEEDLKLLESICRLYGFKDHMQLSRYKSGELNYEGYNMTQFPEGPMWGAISCTHIEGTEGYYLELQVVQKAPKK